MWNLAVFWMAAITVAAGDLVETSHPRLWFPASAENAARKKIASDPLAAKLHAVAIAEAERILDERTCRYDIPDGKRLLAESRRALRNVIHCAWTWRITGEEKFRLRTIAELDAACALKDWNPSHFLDTAEMATAVATGYDWLYPTLTPQQRETYEQAIIEKSLKPAKHLYDTGGWWTNPRNNWAQVCGSGIALAAAAVAGHDEGLSEPLFSLGLKLVESCAQFYEPDGMYPEGPGYWHYGTNYHVMLLAACGPLGQPFADPPILKKGADAIMHLTGPTRLPFNFADGHAKEQNPSPAQCWLAAHFKDIPQAAYVRGLFSRSLDGKGWVSGSSCFPLSILWLPGDTRSEKPLPNAAVFHGEQSVALFRSGWDPNAAWLAVKGGTPNASHGHMDVGSFCYDAHGTRWIHDLGGDNYNMPAYFGRKRFTYYRLQNRSHNTLEIGGRLQNADSKPCPLTSSTITGNPLTATFDLTDAYAGSAKKVLRTASFQSKTGIARIEDEITAPDGDVVWRAFTDADCEIKGDQVVLTKNDQQITLHKLSKAGTWAITDASPPTTRENPNKEFRALVLTVPKAARISLSVEIRP